MLVVILTMMWRSCYSNNVDVESPLIMRGTQPASMFGYSAMMHQISDTEHVYIVGAPRANTSQDLASPGAVFRCRGEFSELKHTVSCDDWLSVFDSTDDRKIVMVNGTETLEKLTETKSGQFFGITLARTNESIIGCANLYMDHYGIKSYLIDRRLPIGRCSSISLDLETQRGFLYPCRNVADSHESYGSCIAGTSVAQDEGKIAISAPNANTGSGNSFVYKEGVQTPTNAILESLTSIWRGSVPKTRNRTKLSDYAGYSTVFCDVNGDGTKELILGMPRAYTYRGSIRVHFGSIEEQTRMLADPEILERFVLSTQSISLGDGTDKGAPDTSLYRNLGILCPSPVPGVCDVPMGTHMGSYFGHTMTCGDVNNDGFDDLIISSPYFSDLENRINDIGKVEVFFGNATNDATEWYFPFPQFEDKETTELFGNIGDSGLFGYSLNCEGDLNADGIKDLVVGAPYEDDGQGAVYVFNGGNGSFRSKYSQKITPLLLKENLQGFGSAISSGIDIDKMGGDELLVGSFLSDVVVSMRTIPTIDIRPTLQLKYDVVNLEKATYLDPGTGENTVGNTLRITINTTGVKFPNDTIQLNWKLILDPVNTDPVDKRAYVRLNKLGIDMYEVSGFTVLVAGKVDPLDTIVNVLLKRRTIRDTKNLFIDIEGSLEAIKNSSYFSSKYALTYELFRNARVPIKIDTMCNENTGVCSADVGIKKFGTELLPHGYQDRMVVINKIEHVKIFVTLLNKGPNIAYDTTFNLTIPPQLELSSVTEGEDVECGSGANTYKRSIDCTDDNLTCTVVFNHRDVSLDETENQNYTVECRVIGAFNQGEKDITIDFLVNTSRLTHKGEIKLYGKIGVGPPSVDPNPNNNNQTTVLESRHLADIRLTGGADKETQFFTNHILPDFTGPSSWDEIGPEVIHSLSVTVDELMDVESVTDLVLRIRWPLKRGSQYVLYITEIHIPETFQHMITCQQKYVDPLGLKPAITTKTTPPVESTTPSKSDDEPEIVEEELFGYGEDATYNCTWQSCHVVECRIAELQRGSNLGSMVKLEIRARLWESTFRKNHRITVTSYSRIESVGNLLILPLSRLISRPILSKFILPNKRKGLNLPVILLSALAGLVIVGIILLVLWKKGFFKSNYFKRTPDNLFQTGARRETFNRHMFSAS